MGGALRWGSQKRTGRGRQTTLTTVALSLVGDTLLRLGVILDLLRLAVEEQVNHHVPRVGWADAATHLHITTHRA